MPGDVILPRVSDQGLRRGPAEQSRAPASGSPQTEVQVWRTGRAAMGSRPELWVQGKDGAGVRAHCSEDDGVGSRQAEDKNNKRKRIQLGKGLLTPSAN